MIINQEYLVGPINIVPSQELLSPSVIQFFNVELTDNESFPDDPPGLKVLQFGYREIFTDGLNFNDQVLITNRQDASIFIKSNDRLKNYSLRIKYRFSTQDELDYFYINITNDIGLAPTELFRGSGYSSETRYLGGEYIIDLKPDELYQIGYRKNAQAYSGFDHAYIFLETIEYPYLEIYRSDQLLYAKELNIYLFQQINEIRDVISFKTGDEVRISGNLKNINLEYCLNYENNIYQEGLEPKQVNLETGDISVNNAEIKSNLIVKGNSTFEDVIFDLVARTETRAIVLGNVPRSISETFFDSIYNPDLTTVRILGRGDSGTRGKISFGSPDGLEREYIYLEGGGLFGDYFLKFFATRFIFSTPEGESSIDRFGNINSKVLISDEVRSFNYTSGIGNQLTLRANDTIVKLKPTLNSCKIKHYTRPGYNPLINGTVVKYIVQKNGKKKLRISFNYTINSVFPYGYNDDDLPLFEAWPSNNINSQSNNGKINPNVGKINPNAGKINPNLEKPNAEKIKRKLEKIKENKGNNNRKRSVNKKDSFFTKKKGFKISGRNFSIHELLKNEPIKGTEIKNISKFNTRFIDGDINIYCQYFNGLKVLGSTIISIEKDGKIKRAHGKLVKTSKFDINQKDTFMENKEIISNHFKDEKLNKKSKFLNEFWVEVEDKYVRCKEIEVDKQRYLFNSRNGKLIRKLIKTNYTPPLPTNYVLPPSEEYRTFIDTNEEVNGLAETNDFVGNESTRRILSTYLENPIYPGINFHVASGKLEVNGISTYVNFSSLSFTDEEIEIGSPVYSIHPDNTQTESYWTPEFVGSDFGYNPNLLSVISTVPAVVTGYIKEFGLESIFSDAAIQTFFFPNAFFQDFFTTPFAQYYVGGSTISNSMSIAAHETHHSFQYLLDKIGAANIMFAAPFRDDFNNTFIPGDYRDVFIENYGDLFGSWGVQYINNASVIDPQNPNLSKFNKTDPTRELYISDACGGFGWYSTVQENQVFPYRNFLLNIVIPPYVVGGSDWDINTNSIIPGMPIQRISYILQNGTKGEEMNEFGDRYLIEPPDSINPDPKAAVALGFNNTFLLLIWVWILYIGPSVQEDTYEIFKDGLLDVADLLFGPNSLNPKPQYINAVNEGLRGIGLSPNENSNENEEMFIDYISTFVYVGDFIQPMENFEFNSFGDDDGFPPWTVFAGQTIEIVKTEPLSGAGGITNDLTGKIALMEQSDFISYIDQIYEAYFNGAVAVYLINRIPPIFFDGGDIPIPASIISSTDGDLILSRLLTEQVNATFYNTFDITDPAEYIFRSSLNWFDSIGLEVSDVNDIDKTYKISGYQYMYVADKIGNASYYNGVATEVSDVEVFEHGTVNFSNLPTDANNLQKGDLYVDNGFLKIA